MNANSCHQNRGKAIFELKNYGDMINKYVAGGLMPSNNNASADTREAASQCFRKCGRENDGVAQGRGRGLHPVAMASALESSILFASQPIHWVVVQPSKQLSIFWSGVKNGGSGANSLRDGNWLI